MAQYLYRISVSESSGRILGCEYQVADCLLVVAPSLEMQGKFSRQFQFAGIAKRREPLRQLQVQFRTSDLGEPPVQNFPIERVPESIVCRNLAVRQLVNSDSLNELHSFRESLASIFNAAGVEFGSSGYGPHGKTLTCHTGTSQDTLLYRTQLPELHLYEVIQ